MRLQPLGNPYRAGTLWVPVPTPFYARTVSDGLLYIMVAAEVALLAILTHPVIYG